MYYYKIELFTQNKNTDKLSNENYATRHYSLYISKKKDISN